MTNATEQLQSALRSLDRLTGTGAQNPTQTFSTLVRGFTAQREDDSLLDSFTANLLGSGLFAALGSDDRNSLFSKRNISSFTNALSGGSRRRTSRGQNLSQLSSLLSQASRRYL